VLGKLGPTRFDRHSEEWQFHFSFKSDDPARFEEDKLIPRMRAILKIPELDPKVLSIGHWVVQGVLADRFRFGRVLLGGAPPYAYDGPWPELGHPGFPEPRVEAGAGVERQGG